MDKKSGKQSTSSGHNPSSKAKRHPAKATGTKGTAGSSHHEDASKHRKPKKECKKSAAVTIQRFFRGWLQRCFLKISKQKAMKRSTCFRTFLISYRQHCMEIMRRHENEDPKVYIDFFEVNDYIERIIKFEVTFQMSLAKDQTGLKFRDLRTYYTKLNLHPSDKELKDAASIIHADQETFWEHEFTKKEVIDISLHIYVPKGTRMVVRKSTWLHPIVDGHEAMGLTLPKNLAEKTSAHKALSVVIGARNEREKLEKRVAEIKQERGANLVVSHETARKSKSRTKLGK